jgi:hypothetical protein
MTDPLESIGGEKAEYLQAFRLLSSLYLNYYRVIPSESEESPYLSGISIMSFLAHKESSSNLCINIQIFN